MDNGNHWWMSYGYSYLFHILLGGYIIWNYITIIAATLAWTSMTNAAQGRPGRIATARNFFTKTGISPLAKVGFTGITVYITIIPAPATPFLWQHMLNQGCCCQIDLPRLKISCKTHKCRRRSLIYTHSPFAIKPSLFNLIFQDSQWEGQFDSLVPDWNAEVV